MACCRQQVLPLLVRQGDSGTCPWMRKMLILEEELTYWPKRGPEPKWMKDDL